MAIEGEPLIVHCVDMDGYSVATCMYTISVFVETGTIINIGLSHSFYRLNDIGVLQYSTCT